jgi:hypothetical protein
MSSIRKVFTIRDFSGGFVNTRPTNELRPNEFSAMSQCIGDRVSFLRSLGTKEIVSFGGNTSSYNDIGAVSDGYGLIVLHSDYEYNTTGGCDSVPTDMLIFATASGVSVKVISISDSAINSKVYTDITASKADMYKVDGAVRITDTGMGSTNSPKWFGYIARKFLQTNAANTVSDFTGWVFDDAQIFAPTAGAFTSTESTASSSPGTTAHKVAVYMHEQETPAGYDWNKQWEAAVSFVFDGQQESLITKLYGTVTISGEYSSVTLTCYICGVKSNNYAFNKRISAINIYLREFGTEDWLLQSTNNIESGALLPMGTYPGGVDDGEGGGVPI